MTARPTRNSTCCGSASRWTTSPTPPPPCPAPPPARPCWPRSPSGSPPPARNSTRSSRTSPTSADRAGNAVGHRHQLHHAGPRGGRRQPHARPRAVRPGDARAAPRRRRIRRPPADRHRPRHPLAGVQRAFHPRLRRGGDQRLEGPVDQLPQPPAGPAGDAVDRPDLPEQARPAPAGGRGLPRDELRPRRQRRGHAAGCLRHRRSSRARSGGSNRSTSCKSSSTPSRSTPRPARPWR